MATTCPNCNAVIESSSRFCTNCGAILETQGKQARSGQVQASWGGSQPGQYQQWGGAGASPLESLGFASQNATLDNDALIKKALLAIVGVIVGGLALLTLIGILAAFIPGLRCFFLLLLVGIFLVMWIIYVNIRRYIRRTLGMINRIGWFL